MRIVLIALIAFSVAPAAFAADQSTTQPAPQLVTAILGAIRKPAPNQFPTPESVVKFLLEQVQKQDLDEATKAFPIVEHFERNDLATMSAYLQIIDPMSSPMPQSPFRNLSNAMRPLAAIDQISLAMLGADMTKVTILKEHGSDADLKPIIEKLDRSRLSKIEIGRITSEHMLQSKEDDPYTKKLNITARTQTTANLKTPDGKKAQVQCLVEKIDGNWRITSCQVSVEDKGQ
jgi:hypothetical protein